MALSHNQVTITTSATLILAGDPDGVQVYLKASGTGGNVDVYLGGASVTASNGFILDKGEYTSLFLGPNEVLYGIVAEGTGKVYYLATMNQ